MPIGICTTCGSAVWLVSGWLVGLGVCRDDRNPNDDDEGQHLVDTIPPTASSSLGWAPPPDTNTMGTGWLSWMDWE